MDLIRHNYKRLRLSIASCPEYRVPTIEEMLSRKFSVIYICDIYHTLASFYHCRFEECKVPELYISVIAGCVKWFITIWNPKYISFDTDVSILKEVLDRGLIMVPIYKNDLVDVWIKRHICYTKYNKFIKNRNLFIEPFVYKIPYWVAMDIIKREKKFGRDPNKTISLKFDENIAINTIMRNCELL